VIKKVLILTLKTMMFTLILGFSCLLVPRVITQWYARSRTFSVDTVGNTSVAVVFGAGLWRDGSPTPVLRDRVETAVALYQNGRVSKLLMSGDNRFVDYNEPEAMKQYALELGVPEQDIVLDYAGRRTYDTCYRAREIFGLTDAILVTQGFHLPRALYTCNMLGVTARGVPADLRQYRTKSMTYWQIRETIATLVALWQVHITHPLPILGEPEPIFISVHPTQKTGGKV
jgi:SanA protein